MKTIYLVLPCYNEEAVLHETSSRLKVKMNQLISENKISKDSRVTFVDDGSKDNTWSIIEELKESDELFAGVKLSRNRGHQNALLAGLMTVKDYCDAAISLDADLQDDINVIDKFIDRFIDGCDVVYGVRSDRKTDTVFKRTTAQGFYKVMKLLGVDIVYNHADYRLMSKRALDALEEFKEDNNYWNFSTRNKPDKGYSDGLYEVYIAVEKNTHEPKYEWHVMIDARLILVNNDFLIRYLSCGVRVGEVFE